MIYIEHQNQSHRNSIKSVLLPTFREEITEKIWLGQNFSRYVSKLKKISEIIKVDRDMSDYKRMCT